MLSIFFFLYGCMFSGFSSHCITLWILIQSSVISMVTPTWLDSFEGTPLWETWNERTSEFTHFNLVIRLSKVKQLALFRVSPGCRMCWTAGRSTGLSPFLFLLWGWQPWNILFFAASAFADIHSNMEGTRHVLLMQVWSFEVQTICAPNSWRSA